MKYLIISLFLLVGCDKKQIEERVVCDSGFSTPWSGWVIMNNGIIKWAAVSSYKRRMVAGEICHYESRNSINK